MNFTDFFYQATGKKLYPYQERLAKIERLPEKLDIPTGLGKTAAVVLAWLWRRRFADKATREATPRRLVYCLPMRVLVEQTTECAKEWINKLSRCGALDENIAVHVLMGGEIADDWDMYPECEALLVGTQDMLLSRALNRGYGMSRYRWPMHFGLLNNDCLWVLDEVQLMGSGLATTAQLEAFRRAMGVFSPGPGAQSLWMSATLAKEWLETVDFKKYTSSLSSPFHGLEGSDFKNGDLDKRWNARKNLHRAEATISDAKGLAEKILTAHNDAPEPKGRTLVVMNTVERAIALYNKLLKLPNKEKLKPILLHSRFRPPDRRSNLDALLAKPPPEGVIAVSTQVVEAGVDVSAQRLFTELAPWASLVQRFGRCNRRGEYNSEAKVFWIDLPNEDENSITRGPCSPNAPTESDRRC